ncbi:MAG: MMPL family transporter [Alphaproteobacteria bacterium]|nr:MMPL family transporter [Alphaproteobacteria bacterium]
MVTAAFVSVVDFCRRRALLVALLGVALGVLAGAYTITHIAFDTNTAKLIDSRVAWRQREIAMDRAFPQNTDLLAIVIDAATPDLAEDATDALTKRLKEQPKLFQTVRQPDGGEFFRKNGLLFLSVDEIQQMTERIIQAQPLIGALAADPSLRGLLGALSLGLEGVRRGDAKLEDFERPFIAIAEVAESVLAGTPRPLSWQYLFTGRAPVKMELRRFILVQPVLDYAQLSPGQAAQDAVRAAARELGLTPEHGVRVRQTGDVALDDEEFATVAQGAGLSTSITLVLVIVILFLALRSLRLIGAILVTLLVGLLLTGGFAALTVGTLNLISIGFAVLFVGIAVDFSIQLSIRFRDERYRADDLAEAMRAAARRVGGALALAAITTAAGFFSFLPTDFRGVSELGLIAGGGMLIALVANLTLLPALLTLFRPPGERAPVGFAWAAPIDAWLLRRRRLVLGVSAAIALLGLALTPRLTFDFNPLNLKDPTTESMSTVLDLMSDPNTTFYTIDVLAPSIEAAQAMRAKLDDLPEVEQAVAITSYVPKDQEPKLALIQDAAMLLGPTLSPPQTAPAPRPADNQKAVRDFTAKLEPLAAKAAADAPAARLARALDGLTKGDGARVASFADMMTANLAQRLADLRQSLEAQPVTLDDLPKELRDAWVAADGQARVEVFPKGDTRSNAVIETFVDAVLKAAPDATGAPVSIRESARTIVHAFAIAGVTAVVVIAALLLVTLRRPRDVALVLAPLLLAALMSLITCIAIGLPLDFANIIALPLLLGIGVAFDIYFVMNWRAGLTGPLQSSTARAVLFSALTTTTAFGSLAVSRHPGTAGMGLLLTIGLFYTVVCTLFVLPALLGPPKQHT